MKRNLTRMLLGILCMFPTIYNYGQENDAVLKIGDKAPDLKVEWIKGTPVESFNSGKLYVIEFWATWCGPCKSAMPHLSEMARQYRDKVTFIGVNIWEKVKTGQQYESVYPAVKSFVTNMGDKMDYNVAAEKNDLYMSTNWMKASGENGIPASFLVKDGKVIWIGHPINLDSTLLEVFAGTYDMEKYAKESKEAKIEGEKTMATYGAINKNFKEALAAKDYQKALEVIDNGKATIDSAYWPSLDFMKFEVYTESNPREAYAYAKKLSSIYPAYKGMIGQKIATKGNLSKELYLLSVEYLQELAKDPRVPTPLVYDLISQSYYNSGDLASAISYLEKTISSGEESLKTGGFDGAITPETISGYKETLTKYKNPFN